jgi:hypothetical protein
MSVGVCLVKRLSVRWVDVAGAPAAGKSTLCDCLWPRHLAATIDPSSRWDLFATCARSLINRLPDESAQECRVIFERYLRKAATIAAGFGDDVYINTGLAQAGLEIGWRMEQDISEYFCLMPVSVGVAFLMADEELLVGRNRARSRDRAHMVAGMERTRAMAELLLLQRGARVLTVNTSVGAVGACRERLQEFARHA